MQKAHTWWPYIHGLRERDIGWRIDYFFVTKPFGSLIRDVFIQREILGSDHAPYGIILNTSVEITKRPTYTKTEPQSVLF